MSEVKIILCDICSEMIEDEEPFELNPGVTTSKQIGCDLVITPPGKRIHAVKGRATIRANISFYCGHYTGERIDTMHFHKACIESEAKTRFLQLFREE